MSEGDHETQRVGPLRLSPGRLLPLFAFGGVVLTTFDGFHTYSGTTRYASTLALRAAWWAPLNFGLAAAAGGSLYALIYQTLGGRRAPPAWSRLVPALAIFGGLYAWSGFFHGANVPEANETKLVVLGLAALALWAWLDRTLAGAGCAVITALTGPLVEVLLVRAGAFVHLQPDFLGVPMWLPALYACSAPVVGQGARRWLLASPSAEPEPQGR